MSTTTQSTESTETEIDLDPASVFQQLVFEDSGTCSSCFRQLRSDGQLTTWAVEGHDKIDKDPRPRYHDGDSYGEIAAYPMVTVCSDCGSVDGRAPDDTLSKSAAVTRAGTLADRLAELGYLVDVNELQDAVAGLKSYERISSYDTEIFARATKIAIQRSR